jgi:hypothetical protein
MGKCWYSDDCHKHIVYDDLVRMMIYLNVIEKAGVQNP